MSSVPMQPSARVREVIQVEYNIGKGVQGDPVRRAVAYYDLDGTLLVDVDRWWEWSETSSGRTPPPPVDRS